MTGKEAYQLDVKRCPTYEDGTKRKHWNQLGEVERFSWERNPTARSYRNATTSN